MCPSDGELVGVHLQARYMQAQEGGHLVELLAYPDEPPRLFASSLLSPLPPPAPPGWQHLIAMGGRVQVQRQLGYTPALLVKAIVARDVLKWTCRIIATGQEVTLLPQDARPLWVASRYGTFEFPHASGSDTVPRLLIQPGTRVRVTGRHDLGCALSARVGTAVVAVGDAHWYVRLDGDAWQQQQLLAVNTLQPVAPPPLLLGIPTLDALACSQTMSYLRRAADEATLLAATLRADLPLYASVVRTPKVEPSDASAVAQEFRETLLPFASTAELHAALRLMNTSKTGRSVALEHLLHLPLEHLGGVLVITDLAFAGEASARVKRGTISPLCKDLARFRPVTFLEPYYQVVDGTMAQRISALLARRGLLNASQRGFVVNGTCFQVVVEVNEVYEAALKEKREAHVILLDANAAFDSSPHIAFDVSYSRLGAPDDFVAGQRGMLGNHSRVVVTAGGVDGDERAQVQEGGEPQGGRKSPNDWNVILDPVLDYAAAAGGEGFRFLSPPAPEPAAPMAPPAPPPPAPPAQRPPPPQRAPIKSRTFADDCSALDGTRDGVQRTGQSIVFGGGVNGVRFTAPKSFYAWSPEAERDVRPPPMTLAALDADGRWREQELT